MDDLTTAALDAVNRIRRELKLAPLDDLVKGIKESPQCCPLANSIRHGTLNGVSIFTTLSVDGPRGQYIMHRAAPEVCTQWASEFDGGEYPEYEEVRDG